MRDRRFQGSEHLERELHDLSRRQHHTALHLGPPETPHHVDLAVVTLVLHTRDELDGRPFELLLNLPAT